MGKSCSKWIPRHVHWYEDLVERDAPEDRKPKLVDGDMNAIDGICLEVSRASTLIRGAGVVFGTVGIAFLIFGLVFIATLVFDSAIKIDELLVAAFGLAIAVTGLLWGVVLLLRLDLTVPRDRPVRFNRIRNKVFVYEHAFSINSFAKWPIQVKVFDWNTLQAELHRQAGFNGKAYVQRFSLWLVSVKPGTNEVEDRFELKGNHPTTAELYNLWAYCRHYMRQGLSDLPKNRPRRQEISFRRSLFEYLRFLDPSQEGKDERAQMTISEWAFSLILFLLAFWLLFPMGIGHYVAMRFAPEAKWPVEIDKESRTP